MGLEDARRQNEIVAAEAARIAAEAAQRDANMRAHFRYDVEEMNSLLRPFSDFMKESLAENWKKEFERDRWAQFCAREGRRAKPEGLVRFDSVHPLPGRTIVLRGSGEADITLYIGDIFDDCGSSLTVCIDGSFEWYLAGLERRHSESQGWYTAVEGKFLGHDPEDLETCSGWRKLYFKPTETHNRQRAFDGIERMVAAYLDLKGIPLSEIEG